MSLDDLPLWISHKGLFCFNNPLRRFPIVGTMVSRYSGSEAQWLFRSVSLVGREAV